MSEFVTNMFQYDVTVGITRSEVILIVRNNRCCFTLFCHFDIEWLDGVSHDYALKIYHVDQAT